MTGRIALALIALVATAARADDAPKDFALKDGDRVVFYGDSITDQRLYTTYVETYAVTRFPQRKFTFIHSGWGGDRVGGGGGGRIGKRLRRDVYAYKPTVVTIMLGMNDASYRPFDDKIFDDYARGYRFLVDDIKDELPNARLTLIQPSPFDDFTRKPNFDPGYNAVLVRYGEFVKELAEKQKVGVADLNTPVVAALKKAAEADEDLAKKIVPDRVHPAPAGHLLMAAALLRAWDAPALVTEVEMDAAGPRFVGQKNAQVLHALFADAITWDQQDAALPMPIDLKDPVMALAVKSSDVVESLDQQTLKVTGLKADEYRLKIDDQDLGKFTKSQLAEGINLATMPTPMAKQAAQVHALTLKHNNLHFQRWRQIQVPLQAESSAHLEEALQALDALEAEMVQQQRQAAQPRTHHYSLNPQD